MSSIINVFDSFIRTKQAENKAKKTVSNYRLYVRPLVDYIGPDRDISSVLLEDVQDYFLTFYSRPLSPASVACYIRHCKAFLSFAEKKYGLPFSASEIKVPKCPQRPFYIYSPEETKQIFDSVKSMYTWLATRNKCMIALMLDSGLRRGEICSLRWKWVEFEKRRMKVYGKGRKERYVPLGSLSASLLRRLASECPFSGDMVFYDRSGEPINDNAVKLVFSKLSDKLPFPFYPHLLRHNFATNWCLDQYHKSGKCDIYALQSIMGHSSINVTMVYLHYAESLHAVEHSISHLDMLASQGFSA